MIVIVVVGVSGAVTVTVIGVKKISVVSKMMMGNSTALTTHVSTMLPASVRFLTIIGVRHDCWYSNHKAKKAGNEDEAFVFHFG